MEVRQMTCKDCIGYKFCSRGRNGQTNFYGKDVACNNVDILCNDFKNKADFVEVVRCSECKYWHNHGEWYGVVSGECRNYDFPFNCETEPCMKADDFCSYGERKETKSEDSN